MVEEPSGSLDPKTFKSSWRSVRARLANSLPGPTRSPGLLVCQKPTRSSFDEFDKGYYGGGGAIIRVN